MDPNDFLRALKEMNNKYIGNRPVKLKASTWKVINFVNFRIENMINKKMILSKLLRNKKESDLFINSNIISGC